MIDIHCHLLPQLDDGPGDWDESLRMARVAVNDGIHTIIATPHQLGAYCQNDAGKIRRQIQGLQQRLRDAQIALQVLPGGDVRIEPGMIEGLRQDQVMTLADHRRHLLLELPHELYFPLDGLLRELRSMGITGILSHPERNHGILDEPRQWEKLVDQGCLMQVTAGSLLGSFGPASQQLGQQMIERGFVHFVASDGHSSTARRPRMHQAFARIVEWSDTTTAQALCIENPGHVARGEHVTPGRRNVARAAGWLGWLRRPA